MCDPLSGHGHHLPRLPDEGEAHSALVQPEDGAGVDQAPFPVPHDGQGEGAAALLPLGWLDDAALHTEEHRVTLITVKQPGQSQEMS